MNKTTKILLIIAIIFAAFMAGLYAQENEIEADYVHYSMWVTDNENLFTDEQEVELTKILSDFGESDNHNYMVGKFISNVNE